ncbi:hypothetical protein BDV09DRAFT_198975 [Aspergillus tetrazonus]
MAAGHYPLGIHFGMKYMTAAYLTATNESVPVAKLEGTQAYKNHMVKLAEDSGIRMVLHRTVYIRSGDSYVEAPPEYHGYSTADCELITDILKDLDESISCRKILLTKLQDLVDSLRLKRNKALDLQSKLKLVFGRKNIDDFQKLLEHQTNAMGLLLAACNCRTGAEQRALLVRSSSRRVFRQMNLDSASLRVHRDVTSMATQTTDTLSKLSVAFSFDWEVLTSNLYERAFRGLTKKVLKFPESHDTSVAEQPREHDGDNGWSIFQQKPLPFSSDYAYTDKIFQKKIAGLQRNETMKVGLAFQGTAISRFVIMNIQAIIAALKRDATGPQLRLPGKRSSARFAASLQMQIRSNTKVDVVSTRQECCSLFQRAREHRVQTRYASLQGLFICLQGATA